MPFTPKEALERVLVHREIFFDEMVELMRQVMRGEVSPVMTAALLTGLRVKKETIGEIAAAASVMREFAAKVEVADLSHLVEGPCGQAKNLWQRFPFRVPVAEAALIFLHHRAQHGTD